MAVLEKKGDDKRTFELGTSSIIGRDPASSIPLVDSLVSRTHAEIRRTPEGRHLIVDLGSTHGTFVSGKRITDCLLSDNDEIIVGATCLRFRDQASDSLPVTDVAFDAETTDATQPWVQERLAADTVEHFPHEKELLDPAALRKTYEKMRAAYELFRAIGGEDDIDRLLEHIVETAFSLLAADRAAILLLDPKTGRPVPKLARRRQRGKAKMVLSRSIINEVVQSKTGVTSADAGSDVRFGKAESVVAEGIRSIMCVPMVHAGELFGVIHLDTQVSTNVFTDKDLELFSSIATQAAIAIKNAQLRARVQEEAKSRVQFQRFLSPNVVDQLMSGRLKLGQAGELREITVFFVDIRGFTRMSEGMKPADLVELLNEYYEAMVEVLFRHGGTFDKYVGDELMALFGAPMAIANAPLAAVSCAVDMLKALFRFNQTRHQQGKPPLQIGFGIHTGEALCGAIGSAKTMQYTAIGDTVNTGSRLCSVAQAGQIVISEQTMSKVRGLVVADALPPARVKGKSEELKLYSVTDIEHERADKTRTSALSNQTLADITSALDKKGDKKLDTKS